MKILIAGDGGQGVQTLAQILSKAAFLSGQEVSFVPNYGLEQRGGMSLAYIQIASQAVVYPRFSHPDYLVVMSAAVRPRIKQYISRSKKVLVLDKKFIGPGANMSVLGLLTKILAKKKLIKKDLVVEEIKNKLGNKSGLEENIKRFEKGYA